jgi:predicted MFS family arabinose efflux permease
MRMVPMAFSAFVGLVAQRFSPRRVIGAASAAAGAVHCVVAYLAISGRLEAWHLAVVAFFSGVALAADFTIRRPLLGSIVPAAALGRAMSLDFSANTVARMVGPALAGFLLGGFGAPAVFVLGALAYAIALASLARVDLNDVEIPSGSGDWASLKEAYRFTRGSRGVMSVVLATITMNLFVFPYRQFVAVVGTAVLGLSAAQIGLLTAVEGAGMTAASLLMAAWIRPRRFVTALNLGVALAAAGVLLFGLSRSVLLSSIAVFAIGVGAAAFANMQPAVVVAESPAELRSRVMGLVGTLIGINPLGLLLLGWLAVGIGPAAAVTAIGSIGLAGSALGGARRVGSEGPENQPP